MRPRIWRPLGSLVGAILLTAILSPERVCVVPLVSWGPSTMLTKVPIGSHASSPFSSLLSLHFLSCHALIFMRYARLAPTYSRILSQSVSYDAYDGRLARLGLHAVTSIFSRIEEFDVGMCSFKGW
ncbi:hypothetical protein C8Q79DRAFT_350399 [Trametes meyenii]|nr:hypothetical protein C8Q79DRAFT_350399 [Trametes meyenii]